MKKKPSKKKISSKKISVVGRGRKPQRVALLSNKTQRAVEAEVKHRTAGEDPAATTTFNNVLTASRMACFLQCQRKHFWSYEIGLRKQEDSIALRVGSAWARAMEARWNGDDYNTALAAALPEGSGFDEYTMAIISGLLAAYYDIYGQKETVGGIKPEVQFKSEIENGFTAEGVMDGLGSLNDGRSAIIESKTTSDSLAPDSDYWLRLSFNMQIHQYIVEARKLDHPIDVVFYDVTRKPMIQPKNITDLDENGLKIVNKDGARVGVGTGEKFRWKQSASSEAGEVLQSHIETPEEFCDRLYKDCLSRPDFYFCRKEIPVIDQEVESFKMQRKAIGNLIIASRSYECYSRSPDAWPRNVSEHTCDFCQFKSFCLQNISVDVNNPPQGFTIQPFNPELK
jgi:hypothetical protein